jgi:nitroreductase
MPPPRAEDAPSFDEVVYTTRAMRRLRPDPVPPELLSQIVEAATMGPCGNHASILPAVQNLMLAARARGLGAILTTLPLAAHDALRGVGGVPDDVTLVACIPLGYPKGRFGRPPRLPADAIAWLDGAPLPPPSVTFTQTEIPAASRPGTERTPVLMGE